MKRTTILTAGVIAAALAATSAAARPGYATGDVNLRTAPTVRGHRITTIPEGARVDVHGCPSWCRVSYRGYTGWVSSGYISTAGYRRAPAPRAYYYPAPPPVWHGPRHHRHHHRNRYRRHEPGFGFYFGF